MSELLGDRRGSAGDSMLNESGRWCVLGACVRGSRGCGVNCKTQYLPYFSRQ